MFSALVFIISLDSGVAPSGDQVLRINMSLQKGVGGNGHFDSYAREPRLHLTPASHLPSRDAPVVMRCEAAPASAPVLPLHLHSTAGTAKSSQGSKTFGHEESAKKEKKKKKVNQWKFPVEKLGWSNVNA